MNILLLNWRDPTHPWAGGAEAYCFQIARRWVQGGHRVTWFCGRHEDQSSNGSIEGIEIIRRGGFYSVYPHGALCYLTRFRGQFDVILDGANGIPFFTPLYSRIPKIALVHHVHSEVFFRELPSHLAHLANLMERVGMPLVYRHVPFVTVSESSRRALVKLGIPAEQISIVHNGVDCTWYRPGAKSDTPLVAFLGRLRHYKSVDVALRAMPALLDSVPSTRFSIAGSGPARPSLHALVRELGIGDHVEFLGHISDRQKLLLLQRAHVVVNPSLKEGWGLTVLEANACGTPVVGADVAGLRDSIQDGRTGRLVRHGDPQELAEAVGDLLLDHDRRNQLARNAQAWAAQFDWDRTSEQCLQLLAGCQVRRRKP